MLQWDSTNFLNRSLLPDKHLTHKVYKQSWPKWKRQKQKSVCKTKWEPWLLTPHKHTSMSTIHISTHMHVCMHTHTHSHIHSHMHAHTHKHVHDTYFHIYACMHTYTHSLTHACMHTNTHTHTQTHSHMHAHTHTHRGVYMSWTLTYPKKRKGSKKARPFHIHDIKPSATVTGRLTPTVNTYSVTQTHVLLLVVGDTGATYGWHQQWIHTVSHRHLLLLVVGNSGATHGWHWHWHWQAHMLLLVVGDTGATHGWHWQWIHTVSHRHTCYSLLKEIRRPLTLQPRVNPRSAWLGLGMGCYIYSCNLGSGLNRSLTPSLSQMHQLSAIPLNHTCVFQTARWHTVEYKPRSALTPTPQTP